MMGDHNSHHQKTTSTNGNTTGDDREEITRGIVGKKRSSPSSQTESYKVSRPLVSADPQLRPWPAPLSFDSCLFACDSILIVMYLSTYYECNHVIILLYSL